MKASANKPMVPISACMLAAAVLGAPGAMNRLAARSRHIRMWRTFTYWPCLHQPRCPAVTAEQVNGLVTLLPDLAPLAKHLTSLESEVRP